MVNLMDIKPGNKVKLCAYGSKIIERVVVDVDYKRMVLHITTAEEYVKAKNEGRKPSIVGFKIYDVVCT